MMEVDDSHVDDVLMRCLPGEIVVWLAVRRYDTQDVDALAELTRLHTRTIEWGLRSLHKRGVIEVANV